MSTKKKSHEKYVSELSSRPLTVLGVYDGAHKKLKFKCHECGGVWEASASNVLNGAGCHHCCNNKFGWRDNTTENEIISDHGEWVEINISTPNRPPASMLIDKQDLEEIRKKTKRRVYQSGQGYAVVRYNKRSKLIHRMIVPFASEVDHIDGNPLNNRRINLRKCTHQQNMQNRGVGKNNSSGVVGVEWKKSKRMWRAKIKFNNKSIHLGYFDKFGDAVEARQRAEKKYFGEFRREKTQPFALMAKQRTMAEIRRILNVSPSNYRIEIHHEDTVLSLLALAAKNNSEVFWEANGTLEKALPLPHHLKKYLNQICDRVEGGAK